MNRSKATAMIAFSTINSEKKAKELAKTLVKHRLAACVNIVPKVVSIYEWKNRVCEEKEFLLLIKTGRDRLKELQTMLVKLHPYEIPELVAVSIEEGLPQYLNWLMENTKRRGKK